MKKFLILISISLLVGCQSKPINNENSSVYYEIFVASFNDSNGDGVGDINGISEKLPYLQDLGVKNLWLMPISPSPTYHKYDVIDYKAIDKSYGTIEDFKNLIAQAKQYNIEIIIDLVLNHSSSKHPWFIEAKDAYLNNKCDQTNKCAYYNFSNTNPKNYIKINDNLYYEAGFWSEMPDLNLDNEDLRKEIQDITKFWLDLGVKGFRLDAPYHYYDHNTTKNNEFLKWFNDYVKSIRSDSFVVGEVWADQKTIINHYASGIDSLFDFTSSNGDGRIVSLMRAKNGQALAKHLVSSFEKTKQANPKAIDSIFLSNHDQGRSGAYFLNPKTRKLAASIYLLTPAIPFIYYGEEIGMLGSGKDENKRLAMVWGEGKDAKSPKDADYKGTFESSVKAQLNDKDSLLSHYKKIISLRNKYIDINDLKVSVYQTKNQALLALNYFSKGQEFVVVHNLSDELVQEEFSGYKIGDKLDKESYIKNNLLNIAGQSTVILVK